jgi:hypothetical protein
MAQLIKTDKLKFGKYGIKKCGEHEAKSWEDLLSFEAGQNWLKWWSDTSSQGQYANFENSQKQQVKEWLGDTAPQDTRATATPVMDISFMAAKLDAIEALCKTIITNQGGPEAAAVVTAWDEE